MTALATEPCTLPCSDSPPVTEAELPGLHAEIPDWSVDEVNGVPRLRRTFRFAAYLDGLAFVQRVGELAEREGHHPVMTVEWGKVRVSWWTHSAKALLRNDFIMAAKTDRAFADHKPA